MDEKPGSYRSDYTIDLFLPLVLPSLQLRWNELLPRNNAKNVTTESCWWHTCSTIRCKEKLMEKLIRWWFERKLNEMPACFEILLPGVTRKLFKARIMTRYFELFVRLSASKKLTFWAEWMSKLILKSNLLLFPLRSRIFFRVVCKLFCVRLRKLI